MRFLKAIDKKPEKTVPARFEEHIGSLSYYNGYLTFTAGVYIMNLEEDNPEDKSFLEQIEWLDESEPSFILEDMRAAFEANENYWGFSNFIKDKYNIEI